MHAKLEGMAYVRSSNPRVDAAPCPKCAYDLRGHPDPTRCPECGNEVHVGPAISEAIRWVDLRLLDLWSIGVLQATGGLAEVVTLIAIRQGHYVALLLGLMAGLCICTATVWFAALLPGIVIRSRRPLMRTVHGARLGELWRWLVVDALLIVAVPALFMILTNR